VGILVKNFLELGFWISRRFMLFRIQFYFTQDIFGDIGLKPTAASKQKSRESCREYSCKCSSELLPC
jgi:hypothetical protein